MLEILVCILFIFWICGFAFSFGGSTIHLLLLLVVILVVVRLLQGRSPLP